MASSVQNTTDDARAQIAQLRRQVESLMQDRVNPTISHAADRAQTYAQQGLDYTRHGLDYTREQAEALSDRVKDRPLVAIALSAVIGYFFGRAFR